jgi:hypothetical protein
MVRNTRKKPAPAVEPEDADLLLPPDDDLEDDEPELADTVEDGDARLINRGGLAQGHDSRTRKATDSQRRSRAEEDVGRTGDDGLAVSRDEQRRLFRDEWTQNALPPLPEIPGFHLCWLSTTNSYDPIARRVRAGYTPVKCEEMPGFEHLKQHGGQWDGIISCNEMLLFKVPMQIWQAMMSEWHHDAPSSEEETIVRNARNAAEEMRDSEGKALVQLEPGMEQLGRRRKAPSFT